MQRSVQVLLFLFLGLIASGFTSTAHGEECTMSKTTPSASSENTYTLMPVPRSAEYRSGHFRVPEHGRAKFGGVSEEGAKNLRERLRDALGAETGHYEINAELVAHPQGYRLDIGRRGIHVRAHDEAGLFYAMMTLKQLLRVSGEPGAIPCALVEDWPDFPNRGIVLDIGRDRVPEMDTLYALIDQLAEWKLNQFQMYTEHTYAYRDHPVIWENASPMTPAQIHALDTYCRARYVELAPNQNSFGHVERWLRHDAYKHLGELPGGSDLCPVDPACEALLAGMYADLLPNFSSKFANVGCDETWSLGKGRSKQAVEEKGVGRVYMEFLLKIYNLVKSNGKTMMFWGDIIMQHPELIPELPKDMIALEWGYEAGHPFAEHGAKFAASGIPFYVCPGTSAWNSLAGRTNNAVGNLRNAAENGLKNGAIGYLITDWGDGGHWQTLPVSWLGYGYGASVSWACEANKDMDIPRALDAHAFMDKGSVMGRLAYDLGNAGEKSNVMPGNNSVYYMLLQHAVDGPANQGAYANMTVDSLNACEAAINAAMDSRKNAQMDRPDAAVIAREFDFTADLMRFALKLGRVRLESGAVGLQNVPAAKRHELATELAPMLTTFRQLWLERSRCGGLKESVGKLERILTILQAP